MIWVLVGGPKEKLGTGRSIVNRVSSTPKGRLRTWKGRKQIKWMINWALFMVHWEGSDEVFRIKVIASLGDQENSFHIKSCFWEKLDLLWIQQVMEECSEEHGAVRFLQSPVDAGSCRSFLFLLLQASLHSATSEKAEEDLLGPNLDKLGSELISGSFYFLAARHC